MPQVQDKKRPRKPMKVEMPSPEIQSQTSHPPVPLDDKARMMLDGKEYEVRAEDLVKQRELGRGAYGVVETMLHPPSKVVMAVKRIHNSIGHEERKRLSNEVVASMQSENCPQMVHFYGAMFREGDVWICMEVMDLSLDKLIKMCHDQRTSIPEPILGKIAHSMIKGLHYMKQELNLMHRDVKPSNVLMDKEGRVKICDYGISGHLTNSLAKTIQAGCKPYMAPERVFPDQQSQQSGFDIRSDVWSLGITLLELATLSHPYEKFKTPFEQLKQVVEMPPPSLPPNSHFSADFRDFVGQCLQKEYKARPKYPALFDLPFISAHANLSDSDVAQFLKRVLETNDSSAYNMQKFMDDLDARVNAASSVAAGVQGSASGETPPGTNPGTANDSPDLRDFVQVPLGGVPGSGGSSAEAKPDGKPEFANN